MPSPTIAELEAALAEAETEASHATVTTREIWQAYQYADALRDVAYIKLTDLRIALAKAKKEAAS